MSLVIYLGAGHPGEEDIGGLVLVSGATSGGFEFPLIGLGVSLRVLLKN